MAPFANDYLRTFLKLEILKPSLKTKEKMEDRQGTLS